MKKQFETFNNPESAKEEALAMEKKIESGKAKDYNEAEQLVDTKKEKIKTKKREIILTPEQEKAKQGMIERLSRSRIIDINGAIKIKNKFSLPEEIVQQAAKQGMIKCLSTSDINDAIEIKNEFSLPEEIVQQAAKQGIIKCLSRGYINDAIKIKNEFNIFITSQEIIEAIPEMQNFLNLLRDISPKFYNQALKSVDITISLIEFKNRPEQFIQEIKENPFLTDAVMENPKFGSKLLIKFSQFDDLSKQNIKTVFATKKEIMTSNPNIEPESLEFRQLMQEKLKEYKNNSEILEAIKESGINVDTWLNYSETRYFNLESGGSHLAFSETIQTPLDRIKETLNRYSHTLKNVLKEYKEELFAFQFPLENVKEIEEKISQMRIELEKTKDEGNEKKSQGIKRGIENLEKKIEKVKTISLWNKLLSDISSFQLLKNNIFNAQENLIKAENDLQENLSGKMPSGKMVQDLKEKINKAKEELWSKFGILEIRMDNFKTNLPELLIPCLNKERTGALVQEIENNLAEQFDHWQTDRQDLTNLFSEKSDKDKEKMANRPMSIFVWARNPDIDLYQGNYSDCCIRINSEHMGVESTIADYNTDLGIQIVNIWDETKNEPVTAAWCWIGENESGETALVVDNIESNTQYSANYSEQLSKELFNYLKDYAKSIGVKKVVLGKANNNLPTAGELAKMKDDENKYEKTGGYNRADGYFLEAENENVKLIMEAGVKKEKNIPKTEKATKVEFKDLSVKDLSETDFTKIKQLERKIYAGTDLISGQVIIEDIKENNGLAYSIIQTGKRKGKKAEEIIGYIVAVEDETDEGDESVYLEDIAVLPEAQGQGIGWEMLKNLIVKLKEKAKKENKSVLLDMHLRGNSQRFMERHQDELEQMGVKLIEEALVADYYDEGEDGLYKVYEVR